jgi:hypothetical protein
MANSNCQTFTGVPVEHPQNLQLKSIMGAVKDEIVQCDVIEIERTIPGPVSPVRVRFP